MESVKDPTMSKLKRAIDRYRAGPQEPGGFAKAVVDCLPNDVFSVYCPKDFGPYLTIKPELNRYVKFAAEHWAQLVARD